jgi:hypothetical protein
MAAIQEVIRFDRFAAVIGAALGTPCRMKSSREAAPIAAGHTPLEE